MIHFLDIVYRWIDLSFGQITKRRRSIVGETVGSTFGATINDQQSSKLSK